MGQIITNWIVEGDIGLGFTGLLLMGGGGYCGYIFRDYRYLAVSVLGGLAVMAVSA